MTSRKSPFAPFHISTDAFPEQQRLARWREIYGRNIAFIDIEPIGDQPFHASVTFQGLPGVGLVSGSRSAAHYHVTRQHLAHLQEDIVGLTILTNGASTTRQLGREVIGRPGAAVAVSAADSSMNTMHRLGSFITIVLPRPEIAALVPDLGAAYARPIPAENESLRLLIRYIEGLHRGGPLDPPGLAQAAARHIVDLAALAIGAKADVIHAAQQRGVAAARLRAIKDDIRENLGNADFSVATLAALHGVTPRYVHKLFEREGATFSEFLLAGRLDRAAQMLKDGSFAGLTISTIAFECGFSDISYFNRTFRRAYNATPSDIRDAAFRAR